jgi:hypothetical protein
MALPITERNNELTEDLDIVDGNEMLRVFRQSDGQLFSGWRQYPGLYDQNNLESLEQLSKIISGILSGEDSGVVVFSGAGKMNNTKRFSIKNLLQSFNTNLFNSKEPVVD